MKCSVLKIAQLNLQGNFRGLSDELIMELLRSRWSAAIRRNARSSLNSDSRWNRIPYKIVRDLIITKLLSYFQHCISTLPIYLVNAVVVCRSEVNVLVSESPVWCPHAQKSMKAPKLVYVPSGKSALSAMSSIPESWSQSQHGLLSMSEKSKWHDCRYLIRLSFVSLSLLSLTWSGTR